MRVLTQPNAVVHTYDYDALNRLRGLVVSHASSLLHTYEYKLNPSGHRRQAIENSTRTTTYGYDDLYRLKSEAIAGDAHGNNGALSYDLDKVGNRLNRNSSVAAVLSALNQSYNARDWLNSDSYNANGSTLQGGTGVSPVGSFTDTYDFEEHLIVRTKADGSTINLSYDADGNRIAKNILSLTAQLQSSTSWLVDTNNLTGYAQVVEERTSQISNPPSQITRTYTYGNQLLSQAASTNSGAAAVSYYAFDGHGNVRELTDSSGALTDRYDYDAFGNLVFKSGPTTNNNHLYCGEEFDPDLGFYYLRARYLSTDNGRFWSMDGWSGDNPFPISLHKYLYASADPVGSHDPSGMTSLVEEEAVTDVSAMEDRISLPNAFKTGQKIRSTWCKVANNGIWQAHHLIPLAMGGWGSRATARGADLAAGITAAMTPELHAAYHSLLNYALKLIAGIPGNTSAAKIAAMLANGDISKEQLRAALITASESLDLGCAGVSGYNPLTPRLVAEMEKQGF